MIAAEHPLEALAGFEVLEAGGNAFDAAVAAMFTAMVAEPTLTSAGGGGHLMACPAEGTPMCFDFFCDMPGGRPEGALDFEGVWVDFGTTRQQCQPCCHRILSDGCTSVLHIDIAGPFREQQTQHTVSNESFEYSSCVCSR